MRRAASWLRRHPIWSVLAVAVLSAVTYGLAAPSKQKYEYVTVPADRGEVVRVVAASGKLRPLSTVRVGSEISGQVSKVHVDFNSSVEAGQLLAEIDSTRVRARVDQAQAEVQLARAALMQAQAERVADVAPVITTTFLSPGELNLFPASFASSISASDRPEQLAFVGCTAPSRIACLPTSLTDAEP